MRIMEGNTIPKGLIFIDNFIKGWGYFIIVGLIFGFFAVKGPLWKVIKFNVIIWPVAGSLIYLAGYNATLKWAIEEQGKPYRQAKRETERFSARFALEIALLFPLASITEAALYVKAHPNILLSVILIILSSTFWGYIHAKVFTPAYVPIANPKKVVWISKTIYQKWYQEKEDKNQNV
ncbi:hypothetical protein [Thermococcus sp.]|uniref:hypothetical protein n=1 Tax=Thermococcus sp. TaxID=35749 RepID=UPI0026209DE5|nr:hypothetical protein [Thermococcus sp.]